MPGGTQPSNPTSLAHDWLSHCLPSNAQTLLLHMPSQLDDALEHLSDYQYLAFTSKNGIYAVMGRLERLKGSEFGGTSPVDQLLSVSFPLGVDCTQWRYL